MIPFLRGAAAIGYFLSLLAALALGIVHKTGTLGALEGAVFYLAAGVWAAVYLLARLASNDSVDPEAR